MHTPVLAMVVGRVRASMVRFRDDERGSMALIILFTFLAMIMFGGIAVDVMRFETRRVAMQQTLDRAALAAASLPEVDDLTKVRKPIDVANDWFAKTNLDEGLFMVEYATPVVKTVNIPGKREVTMSASVKSHNFFMGIFSPRNYLEAPTSTKAAQGVANVELILVLDITGSMNEASSEPGKTKLEALKAAALSFVDILQENDKANGVSIGIVPYAAQVNMPLALRQQFTGVTNVSAWNGVVGAGVPNIDCIEIPTSLYTQSALPLNTVMPMSAVADSLPRVDEVSSYSSTSAWSNPAGPSIGNRACSTVADNVATPLVNEATANHIMLPTKNLPLVKDKISSLVANGNTNIALGMRWGTALIDENARNIYTAIGDKTKDGSVQGRPDKNGSQKTRKIIVLMTDGEHVRNTHVLDAFKSGPSPIWRGAGSPVRYAIRYWNDGTWHNNNTRPACAGTNEYFIPHLKRAWVDLNNNKVEDTGERGACDPQAWAATPTWPNSGTVTNLDWSEVWRYLKMTWVVQQLYMRSNVADIPTDINAIMNDMRAIYLTSENTMDALLKTNCEAARRPVVPVNPGDLPGAGIEVFGIMFDDKPSKRGTDAIKSCVSTSDTTYYYEPKSPADLTAAFNSIATDISDLRLTQ
jgi:Flp pilus assembly protein TadG